MIESGIRQWPKNPAPNQKRVSLSYMFIGNELRPVLTVDEFRDAGAHFQVSGVVVEDFVIGDFMRRACAMIDEKFKEIDAEALEKKAHEWLD